MRYLNLVLFILFHILRSMRKLSLKALKNLSLKFDPAFGLSFTRINPGLNGYESFVVDRYRNLMKKNFNQYYDNDLFNQLFPNHNSEVVNNFKEGRFISKEKLPNTDSVAWIEKMVSKYE